MAESKAKGCCVVCDQPATQRCPSCPTHSPPAYFCGKACFASVWKQHKREHNLQWTSAAYNPVWGQVEGFYPSKATLGMRVGEVGNASTELLATIEEKSEPLGNRDAAWALLTTHDKRPEVDKQYKEGMEFYFTLPHTIQAVVEVRYEPEFFIGYSCAYLEAWQNLAGRDRQILRLSGWIMRALDSAAWNTWQQVLCSFLACIQLTYFDAAARPCDKDLIGLESKAGPFFIKDTPRFGNEKKHNQKNQKKKKKKKNSKHNKTTVKEYLGGDLLNPTVNPAQRVGAANFLTLRLAQLEEMQALGLLVTPAFIAGRMRDEQRDEPLSPLRGVCNANGLDRTFNIGAFALTGCLSLLIERLTLYPLAGYAHWGELCVLDTLHQVLASPLLGPASKTASEPTAALPELARTAPHGLDRDCAEEMESVWIVEDCAAILPQIFSVLASGQCLPVAAADLDVKTATLHYTSLVGVLELYFARVCVPMLDILGCEVIKATGEWAEKGLVKLRANQSLGDTRQLQKTVRARLTQLHTRVSVFLRGRTSTQVYSPFNFNPKVRRERTVFMLRATLNRVTGYRSSHKGISMQTSPDTMYGRLLARPVVARAFRLGQRLGPGVAVVKLEIDMQAPFAAERETLVQRYLAMDKRFSALAGIAHLFFIGYSISPDPLDFGQLGRYGVCLLVITFLQCREMLQGLQPGLGATPAAFAALEPSAPVRCCVLEPSELATRTLLVRKEEPFADLLASFLWFVSRLDARNTVVSARMGGLVSRAHYDGFEQYSPHMDNAISLPHTRDSTKFARGLCVEDPFDPHMNVSVGMDWSMWELVSSGCWEQAQMIASGIHIDSFNSISKREFADSKESIEAGIARVHGVKVHECDLFTMHTDGAPQLFTGAPQGEGAELWGFDKQWRGVQSKRRPTNDDPIPATPYAFGLQAQK